MSKGGMGGGNMNQLLRQAQKMQQDMEKAQQELEQTVIESSSGGGMVVVTITGKKEIKAIKLNKDIVDPEDTEMLEDLLVAAVNEAIRKVEDISNEKMSGITGSMGGLGLF